MNGAIPLLCYTTVFIRCNKLAVVFCDIAGAKTMLKILIISIKNLKYSDLESTFFNSETGLKKF